MHEKFLRRCLELAERARGKTGINPMVAAVLVRDGKIIAEGFHSEYGKAHAERQLLENPDLKIRSTDTLYVNLEPCSHTDKKTPPCAQLLIEKGIKHVVYGMKDPNPAVNGRGLRLLQENGVQVTGPVLIAECLRLNRGFGSLHTKGRPWVTLKSARTVDGRIANDDGSPLRITNKVQDEWSHRFLRAKHDAILVGIGTILRDDPQLTVRFESEGNPYRIILDPSLQIPLEAKVVNAGTIVVTKPGQDAKKMEELRKRGVRIFEVPLTGSFFDWQKLWEGLMAPTRGFHGISSVLVEGGPKTWEVFRREKMVDEEIVLTGNPKHETRNPKTNSKHE